MADPVVHITNGVPDSGTGNITTLGQTLLDGANATIGAKADAASTATDTTAASAISIWKQISKTLQAAAGAVSTAFFAKLTDGTNTAAVKSANTAPAATDPALVVAISPNSVNANITPTGSTQQGAPTVGIDNYATHKEVAASQTAALLGATGAIGDYLAYVVVYPGAANCGGVTILDGASTVGTFAGGGTTALPSLAPFTIPVGAYCTNAGWKITTGANVTVSAVGKFT